MKIVTRGVVPSARRYRVLCSTCKSELEYGINDIVRETYDQRDGTTHYLDNCPVCKGKLFNYSPIPITNYR